jgi:hypothetical protein
MNSLDFFINVLIKVFLLFTILTVFFILIISKVEEDKMKGEINSLIDSYIPQMLSQLDSKSSGILKIIIKKYSGLIQSLNKKYSQPSEVNTIYNKWLFRTSIMISIGLLILLIAVVSVLTFTCTYDIGLKSKLISIFIAFIFIGIIEYLFFRYIAIKYIPIPPSYVISEIITDIKKSLQS